MKSRILILGAVGLFALSGCSGTKVAKYNPFNGGMFSTGTTTDTFMRADTGEALTPMSNNDVTVFQGGQYRASSHNISGATLPNYGGGVSALGDSSVTIFSLDGVPPAMGNNMALMNNHTSVQLMGQNYSSVGGGVVSGGAGNQIFFKNGSSRLGGGDRRVLSNVAEQAKFAPVNRVTVAGYASPPTQVGRNNVRADILNLKESMNRTFAVSKNLIQNGVPAEKIKAVSWGATKPTGSDRQDRRVDIIMGEQ